MDKIEILLQKLENRISPSLVNRLDELENLQEKLEASSKDYEKNPTDENKEKYNEIIDYVENIELGIIRDLENLYQKQRNQEFARNQQNQINQQNRINQQNQKRNENETKTEPREIKSEPKAEVKKENSGVLTFLIGSFILVASFGAINYWKNNN